MMTKEEFVLSKAKEVMETSEPWFVNNWQKIRIYGFTDDKFPNEVFNFMYEEETGDITIVED